MSTTGILEVFRGLKPEPDTEIEQKGVFFKGLVYWVKAQGISFDERMIPILVAFGFFSKKYSHQVVEIDRGGETGKSPFFFGLPNERDQTMQHAAEIELLAEQLLESEGMTLVDVEYGRGPRGRVLRVFIDKPGGVTLDDCALVSRQLGDILDVRMASDEPYHLEVSSPGLDRPLTKPKHFVYFEGRPVVIKTNYEVEGTRQLRGVLAGLQGDVVRLEVGDHMVAIPYEAIAKAHLDSRPL